MPVALDDTPSAPSKLGKDASAQRKNGRRRATSTSSTDANSAADAPGMLASSNRGTPPQQRNGRTSTSAANGHVANGNSAVKPPPAQPLTQSGQQAPLSQMRPWYGDSPQLEQQVPFLLQRCSAAQVAPEAAMAAALEAKSLLSSADVDAPITQFYLGVAVGVAEGEAAACDYYERALKQLPLLHNARNNLIRGLMRRGTEEAERQALEHANLSAGLQPDVAEMHYQLGVVLMQTGKHGEASAAYERTLKLDPHHRGAFVNGVHCLQQFPPGDKAARERLEKVARMAVASGLWSTWLQRPPHLVAGIRSMPWWDKRAFAWCGLLERNYAAIRAEVVELRRTPANFTPVGGRAAHDHTLVATGDWREFPLLGNGKRYDDNCARCPVTAQTMQHVPPAVELAISGGGETLFSTLKVRVCTICICLRLPMLCGLVCAASSIPLAHALTCVFVCALAQPGTHLRPHCGSTNTRLTCHLGVIVPSGCSIRCGEEWREWKEGECIVFDDSWEHEVMHQGDEDRVVLLINFWHPDLPDDQKKIELNTFGYQAI